MYREKWNELLHLGAWGFTIGFMLFLVLNLADGDGFHPIWSAQFGMVVCGIPYGWRLTKRVIGNFFQFLFFPFNLLGLVLHLMLAYGVGLVLYPVALILCFIKMRQEETKRPG